MVGGSTRGSLLNHPNENDDFPSCRREEVGG